MDLGLLEHLFVAQDYFTLYCVIVRSWPSTFTFPIQYDFPSSFSHVCLVCEELVTRIEKEAIESLNKVSSLIVDKQPPPDIQGKPASAIEAKL